MTDQPDSEMGTRIGPAAKATATSELDSAGEAILKSLHKAADVADANSRQAFDTAEKLANQLREAEDQIAELQAEVQRYRDRSERAEQWLRRIYKDIEDRLVCQPDQRRRLSQRQDR
jgi:molecular chaperone GrpE (heat shock protein)